MRNGTMRTLTLEFEPFETIKQKLAEIFAHIHSYSIIETLKMDYREGICIEIMELVLKEGVSNRRNKNFRQPGDSERLEVHR